MGYEQALIIFAGTAKENFVADIPVVDMGRYEKELMDFVRTRHSGLLDEVTQVAALNDDIRGKFVSLLNEFGAIFQATESD